MFETIYPPNLKCMEDKMRELILVTSYWMHLVATIIWIGGITFILFIAMPSSRQVLGADAGKLMDIDPGDYICEWFPTGNDLVIDISGLKIAVQIRKEALNDTVKPPVMFPEKELSKEYLVFTPFIHPCVKPQIVRSRIIS